MPARDDRGLAGLGPSPDRRRIRGVLGRAAEGASHPLPDLHARREPEGGDVEGAQRRCEPSLLPPDQAELVGCDRRVLSEGEAAYGQLPAAVRLLLGEGPDLSTASTGMTKSPRYLGVP